jgi:hypothetical protein
MNRSILLLALTATLSLAACDKQPVVVNVPPAAPGPAGATGATGATGNTGNTGAAGDTGKAGDGTTVIVMPPAASAATN